MIPLFALRSQRLRSSLFLLALLCAACSRKDQPQPSSAAEAPSYSADHIVRNGATEAGPLGPGVIASIYGLNLGPTQPCTGVPDPGRRETPNPARPNQTTIETQVFPESLCDVEVRVGGVRAGLLYVSRQQINFKMPQSAGVSGSTPIVVTYRGRQGPTVMVGLSPHAKAASSGELAARMWSALGRIAWNSVRPRGCEDVAPHPNLRGGLYGYAAYCPVTANGIVTERFYYPGGTALRLRRADIRPRETYPESSTEVEQLLRTRLTREFGTAAIPDAYYEIGAVRPQPGLMWRTGDVVIFLHTNRNHVAPAGVRTGVQLIAVRREVLDEREELRRIQAELGESGLMSHARLQHQLHDTLGELYDTRRLQDADAAQVALMQLIGSEKNADRNKRAAMLVAADELAVRLGELLVDRSASNGSESTVERPGADRVRSRLAAAGVRYTGIGHYSGALEYDRSLLKRAAREFTNTDWGQRATLILQGFSCSPAEVIEQNERLLRGYPNATVHDTIVYQLALAYDTVWSLNAAEGARLRAIELYGQLQRTNPKGPEARAAAIALRRLQLKLPTGERAFTCSDS